VEVIGLKILSGEADFMSYGAGGITLSNLATWIMNLRCSRDFAWSYHHMMLGVDLAR